MRKFSKSLLALVLVAVMAVSLIASATAAVVRDDSGNISYTPLEQGVYSNGGYTIDKVSHPTLGAGEVDAILSGKDQDVITVTFGNDKMGSLLIVKKAAVPGAPISDVEFLVTDSDGNLIGNANGKFVTDSAGTFSITDIAPGSPVSGRRSPRGKSRRRCWPGSPLD